MQNILLDYIFKITSIDPVPAASTAFLNQALVVGKPKDGTVTPGVITLCTSAAAAQALLGAQAGAEAAQLFNAGLSRIFVLPNADLDLDTILAANGSNFFTVLITSDFTDSNITGADFGIFKGVIGVSSTDNTFLATQAAIKNRSAFHTVSANKAKNMMFAFGALLSNFSRWKNQQYISMPFADDVSSLGTMETLFDDRISFVVSDAQYSNRLAFFAAGGQAITAPYIVKNLQIDLQSKALQYLTANQPGYTKTQAALLEDELSKVVQSYIERKELEAGVVAVTLEEENFVGTANINIAEPKALWRVFAEMSQTL